MGCGIGARETMRPHVRHAALPAQDVCDASVVAFDVPVVTIMAVVPPRVMAGVIGARMAPCTVMRSCRSRGGRYGDCRRTQRQRDETKRPAQRNQLNHTQSSVAPPFPRRRRERRTPCCVLEFWIWRHKDGMRQCGNDFGVIPRKFDDEKRNDAAALRPRALTAIFRRGIFRRHAAGRREARRVKNKKHEGAVNALRRHQR